jgi:hypothetical protein
MQGWGYCVFGEVTGGIKFDTINNKEIIIHGFKET